MRSIARSRRKIHVATIIALSLALALPSFAGAAPPPLVQISSNPYTNPTSQHQTEVEPDTFARGSTIVSAFQVGRFYDGGASNVGWATSQDSGATWTRGYLPGITIYGGGTLDRASDPVVAYDAAHNVWLIASLGLVDTPSVRAVAVLVNRSTDGGLTWSMPVVVGSQGSLDKDWIVCDNTATSPFYGRCYAEWDDNGRGNLIQMSASTDGGATWGPARTTANNATGLGGQPLVQPNGTVIVPIANAFIGSILAFRSTDGGASWSSTVTIAQVRLHPVAGGLRSDALPSAEIDRAGKVYVVWQDCRFRTNCASNDIVMSTSTNGTTWSSPARIPIDSVSSGIDHFVPGIGVARLSSGASARIGLTYYYYPNANCTTATCQLDVGFVSSTNGGATWSAPTQLAGPMQLSWLAATNQGRMVGDYISTSFVNGKAYPVFAVAKPPSGGQFDQGMYTPASGLSIVGGGAPATSEGVVVEPGAPVGQPVPAAPLFRN